MALKLPPKLVPPIAPFTLSQWDELDFDSKDPKVYKSLIRLNKALINLKNSKPPTSEDFAMFTEETAFIIPRFKKMLAALDTKDIAYVDFCEPFYELLKKWQKGATKIEDVLEEGEVKVQDAKDAIQEALPQAQLCQKKYAALAQRVGKELKTVTQLAAIAKKDKTAPKLVEAVNKLKPDDILRSMRNDQVDCELIRDKFLYADTLKSSLDFAKQHGDKALASVETTYLAALAAVEKLAKAVDSAIKEYEEIVVPLVENVLGLKIRR